MHSKHWRTAESREGSEKVMMENWRCLGAEVKYRCCCWGRLFLLEVWPDVRVGRAANFCFQRVSGGENQS